MILKACLVVLSLCSITTVMSGCGKKKSSRAANVVEYFIHGDPLLLVEGKEVAGSFLTPDNVATYNNFHFISATSFIEREPKAAPTTYEQVEQANTTEAPAGVLEKQFELLAYSFSQVSGSRWEYRSAAEGQGYRLGFELRNGLLELVDFNDYPVTAKHYSLKADGKAFSLLVSYEDPTIGKLLTAFYFADSAVVNPLEKAAQGYAYLFDTVKIRWDEPLKVEACGTMDPLAAETIRLSSLAWFADTAPSATPRPVTVSARATYAPFSDLNQHCIMLIDDFKLENSDDFYTAGVTLPIINLASKRIIDSDVMLFMDHGPVYRQTTSGSKSSILMHELGHFYGLGHEFKTDADGNALHPSIMAYRNQTSDITPWDFEAVRELYGESLMAAP